MSKQLTIKSKKAKPGFTWPGSALLLILLAASPAVLAVQLLSEDEMRNSTELLASGGVTGIAAEQLDYLQRENEQGNGQLQQAPVSLLKVSSQQTLIQDARRAAEARNTDLLQQRWLEYRKSMLAKDPTVIWFYSTQ